MSFFGDVFRGVAGIATGGVSEGYFGNKENSAAQAAANAQNIAEAQKNRDFQERMSGSAYQRAMADMRLAGLNPMLAFSQGGASVPSGSQATVQSTREGDKSIAASKMIPEGAQQIADLKVKGSTANQAASQAKLNDAGVEVKETEKAVNLASAKQKAAETRRAEEETKRSREEGHRVKRENEILDSRREIDKKLAPVDAIIRRIGEATGAIGSGFRSFFRGKDTSRDYGRGHDDGFRKGVRHGTPVP